MKRTDKMDWYVGKLVRLSRDLERNDGTVIRCGRVLEIRSHYRGRVWLVEPGETATVVGKVPFCDFELAADH